MKRSIWTKTHRYVDGRDNVSEIHTSNKYLILYLQDLENFKKSTVIDIDFKNKIIWIKKNDGWEILFEKMDNKKGLIQESFKTEEQWSREVAQKL